ncbi:AAA family ATPase [Undibacterium sp. Ji50W]|uniref:AAA family ATPase n=1 Tax=Undibacterium sp. Ji50W TaxID=3413041 RepID=UPI003BF193C2
MEAIIFIGLQASGKSSFYKEHFFNSHLRISNDLLKTKNRHTRMLDFCFDTGMPFVIDNTNPTKEIRAKYLEQIKARQWRVTAYYFKTDLERALAWNGQRQSKDLVPKVGILDTHKKLEIPDYDEGFDHLYYVDFIDGRLTVTDWKK